MWQQLGEDQQQLLNSQSRGLSHIAGIANIIESHIPTQTASTYVFNAAWTAVASAPQL